MKLPIPMDDTNISQQRRKTSEQNEIHRNGLIDNERQQDAEEKEFPHYKRVSDYLLGTCVGEGSFAKVRVGLHCPTKEKVAIKIINKAKAKRDSYVFKNLHREGKIMQMLRHPNIVQVFDILETGNNYYLVTELCSGGELIDIVTDQGSLPEGLVQKYIYQLVNAVAYMHERKIIHRDLKVENLLLDSGDNLKIIDFGLSNVLPEPCSDTSCALATQCGSPAYAAPELLAKKMYGPKVDVWSIGVITFALLVGKLPFTVEPFNIPKLCKKMVRGDMNPIPSYISPQCRVFIRKLLSPDQVRRPTINDVMRLKWAAAYQEIDAKSSKNSVSSLLINRLTGDSSVRRRHLALIPLTSSPIDSSIVKDMAALYGFACSDIIQCVHKNRPGPLLATYHLLSRRKKSKHSERTGNGSLGHVTTHHVDRQHNQATHKQNPTPTVLKKSPLSQSEDDLATDDGDSGQSSNENLTITPPLPKIRTPEKSNETSENDVPNVLKEIVKKETKLLFSENKDNPMTNGEHSEVKVFKNTMTPTIDFRSPIPSLSQSKTNHVATKTSTVVAKQSSDGDNKDKRSNKAPTSVELKYTRPANSVLSKDKSTEVNDLLASMRKAREVLERRQKVQQRNRLNLTKPANQVKPTTSHEQASKKDSQSEIPAEEKLPNSLREATTRKSLQIKISNRFLMEPRSVSQQATRQKMELSGQYLMQSPYTRPASHNTVLSKMPDGAFKPKRYVHAPNSPPTTRLFRDQVKLDEKDRAEQKSPNISSRTKRFTPSALPTIPTKPKTDSTPGKQTTLHPLHGELKPVRHSFPASIGYVNGSNHLSLPSQGEKGDLIQNTDIKLPVPSKWQKTYSSNTNRSLSKSKNGQHLNRSQSEYAPRTTHGPRKVISEPIAAAISYLTSTKNRAFRKEKATSLSAS